MHTAQDRANNINFLLKRIVSANNADSDTLCEVETKLSHHLSHLENQCNHCFDEGECPWCNEQETAA